MIKINIHSGHNPSGKVGCGAVGIIDESIENRKVEKQVLKIFKNTGAFDLLSCTINDGTSQENILSRICRKSNLNKCDLNISIHFNSGANDLKGNNKTTGTEVFIYPNDKTGKKYATKILKEICKCGFKNRGVKDNNTLYVLRNTTTPCILIEVCFVDDKDDVKFYDYKKVAHAIVKGIILASDYNFTATKNLHIRKFDTSSTGDKLPKNSKFKIDYVRIKNNNVYGRIKNTSNYVLLKNVK